MPVEHDRAIPVEGAFNFRDLGGYSGAGGRSVRWRRLFRADGLHRIPPEAAAALRHLGIVTVIDLRTAEEVTARGRVPDELGATDYHHLPMFDVLPDWSNVGDLADPGFLADRYAEMLDVGRATVGTVLRLLAEPSQLPAVFHCAAGKDRTGIVAALVLELLGVERNTVVADYALSHEAMVRLDEWVAARSPEYVAVLRERPTVVGEARPHTMERFLAFVDDRYGSVTGLAQDLGVGAELIARLQANLLELDAS